MQKACRVLPSASKADVSCLLVNCRQSSPDTNDDYKHVVTDAKLGHVFRFSTCHAMNMVLHHLHQHSHALLREPTLS